ncbi:zinc-binding dehydrogenase [Kroppenstedtia eburnea]|uniref:L-iditol 2-dehydrogenase n=1 Tax=Kroppenstedtia eburnea TaxID=714067 RepID=A0A1N7MG68_9BACL|nr:zinc-binding dehydrogenase [Kroppenstedtia eburnea]QKI81553.1 zinc-binding dehydrogenase [Kroppenstedtia eburnea]SIS85083.1 L-iditol 2-dehydrogenase [Kroppenstedtia eburnea]
MTEEGRLKVKEIDRPQITERQALIKTVSCGICGTDATIIRQAFKGFGRSHYPLVLGHEGVGEVVEVGAQVKSFKPGDLIILPFVPEPSEDGVPLHSGWGAFSEYGVIDDAMAYGPGEAPEAAAAQQVLPDFIDRHEAPVLVTLREVLGTIRYFGIRSGESVVVYGSGPVAMTFVKLLRLVGVDEVTAVVRSGKKAELMKQFGATGCINSTEENVREQIRSQYPEGVCYVLDAVGSESIMNEAITLLRDRGEILCYGVPNVNHMTLDWTDAPYNWKLNFQQMPYKAEEAACHEQVLEWVADRKLVLSDFISEIVDFEHVLDAFRDYLEGKTMKKVIIKYE